MFIVLFIKNDGRQNKTYNKQKKTGQIQEKNQNSSNLSLGLQSNTVSVFSMSSFLTQLREKQSLQINGFRMGYKQGKKTKCKERDDTQTSVLFCAFNLNKQEQEVEKGRKKKRLIFVSANISSFFIRKKLKNKNSKKSSIN
ncbi:hypothetical protein RFI_30027 [Reticulomyxa filosa]|uniref:Uncharacterized protein n=1 Tax=Reticulomyxa filosa TaxID=46433 RepID=X6M302_RETFI|nr:hypothetical protein RFI_30027 [Reticulomyxa filosa]|eukprot:ETO07365.1 hypothetical protein RFI_30027 [Reticulomyxa filosa]